MFGAKKKSDSRKTVLSKSVFDKNQKIKKNYFSFDYWLKQKRKESNMKKLNFFIVVAFSLMLAVNSYSQVVGKMFGKEEANKLFGKIEKSVDIKAEDLFKMIEKTDKKVMFRFIKGKVLIAGDERKILNTPEVKVNKKDVFRYFSKEKVVELLNKDKAATIKIEKRAKTITLTNGMDTLEEGVPCPPNCE